MNLEQTLKVKLLNENAKIPTKATDGSVGYDLYVTEDLSIPATEYRKVNLGISIEPPQGYYTELHPRSSSFLKGLHANIGIIDTDFRGELSLLVRNANTGGVIEFLKGDRIAQIIIKQHISASFEEVLELSETSRDGGFGSTGI